MANLKLRLGQKSCPKCGGHNVYLDSDQHGWFEHCLQCGYTGDLEVVTACKAESSQCEYAEGDK